MPWLRTIVVLLVILPTLLTTPTFAASEKEPNNTPDQATPIQIGYANAILTASISTTTDVDYYRFTAGAGRTYVFETFNVLDTPTTYGTGIELYASDGKTLLVKDDPGRAGTGNVDARITYTLPTTATYYLAVKSGYDVWGDEWVGTYSVRILAHYKEPGAAWDTTNDLEPNDRIVLATPLPVGVLSAQTHQIAPAPPSTISHAYDQDWYRFEAKGGQLYRIETFNVADTTSTYGTGLSLYDRDGKTQLAKDDPGRAGRGNIDAAITYRVPMTGTYYIGVVSGDNSWDHWTGTYSIRVLPQYGDQGSGWDPNTDNEPDDHWMLARPLKIGLAGTQTHQIYAADDSFVSHGTDVDWYRVTVQKGVPYTMETIHVTNSKNEGTGLWLYGEDKATPIAEDQRYYSWDRDLVWSSIKYTFPAAGDYYIAVGSQRYTSWTGSYTLRICQGPCTQPLYLPLIRR